MAGKKAAAKVTVMVLFFTLLFSPFLNSRALARGDTLSDISGNWAEFSVRLLAAGGIINGYPDGTFRPGGSVTRAEFAKLIIDALNLKGQAAELRGAEPTFRDVPADHWALPYIELAYERGLMTGYNDGSFRPGASLSRAEAAVVLIRIFKSKWQDAADLNSYTDADAVPQWAAGAVAAAVREGLLAGYTDGTIKPLRAVSRAETAALLQRLLNKRGDDFDFYVQSAVLTDNMLQFDLNGNTYSKALAEDITVYEQGKLLDGSQLAVLPPQPAYITLDLDGKVKFINMAAAGQNAVEVSYTSEGQRPAAAADAGEVQAGLLENTLEDKSDRTYQRQAGKSLEITRRETGITAFSNTKRVDGSGEIIALIDTGIDPGHPDLQMTAEGDSKVLDWIDLTNEGRVGLDQQAPAGKSSFTAGGQLYSLGKIAAVSSKLRYGFFREEQLGMDIDFNGEKYNSFLVLLADSGNDGSLDTVYIDTDRDGDLGEEQPLTLYSAGGGFVSFPRGEQGAVFNMVLTAIDAKGTFINLGFDANGHGTHVAGVAAASGNSLGMAPGAQLLIIKALDKNGTVEWDVLKNALKIAASGGADVVSLSLGYFPDDTMGYNTLTQLMEDLGQKYGTIFTVASGNAGPGVESLATPGNGEAAISVGAYISPEMWLNDYGYRVKSDSLWYFSSIGPRQDGYLAPTIVAPGSAVAAAPLWSGHSYYLGEGTSIAAPHTAGAVALLLEEAAKNKLEVTPRSIKAALAGGAVPIVGLSPVEQGHGKLDIEGAWQQLNRDGGVSPLQALTFNSFLGYGLGLYAREYTPGELDIRVANGYSQNLRAFWLGTEPWIKPLADQTQLPAGGVRNLPVDYRLPEEPGLYSGWLRAYVPQIGGMKLEIPVTVIRPYQLTPEIGYRVEESGLLTAGQYRRYFFKVPEGAGKMDISLAVPDDSSGNPRGRVRFHLIRPDAVQETVSDYIGFNSSRLDHAAISLENPMAGTWEVVVYSSASLSLYGREDSYYRLGLQLRDVVEQKQQDAPKNWLVSILPRGFSGQTVDVTLQVRRNKDLQPIEGTIEVNERLYQVHNGKLTLKLETVDGKLQLKLKY